jgi:site-specific recombinase XerD
MKGCRPLTTQEATLVSKSFSGAYATRDKALFVLGTKSGFRVSELLSLQVRDVYQHGQMVDKITVRRQNMKRKTERRTVLFHPEAKAAVAAWLLEANLKPTDFVFQSRQGGAMTRQQAWNILKEAYEANGLTGQLGTHTMRKSFANAVYTVLGHDLVKTQRALGHKNINSTVSYFSFAESDIDNAVLAI